MILHDSAFETLAKAPVKQSDVIVIRQVQSDTGWVDSAPAYSADGLLMQVKIDAVGEMLGTVTKKATVQLLGIATGTAAGDQYQIRLGLLDDATGEFNYISQGSFIVDSVDFNYDAGSTTITMYDHMWTASHSLYKDTAVGSVLSFPATVEQLAAYVAGLLNVTLSPNFADLPNSQFLIQEDLYTPISNATLQSVIQDIAGATGTTARITDTTLSFYRYQKQTLPFDDPFDTLDATKWQAYNTPQIYVANGQLVIDLPSGSTQYHGLLSTPLNFTNRHVSMKLVSAGNQSLASLEAYPVQLRTQDAQQQLSWVVTGGNKTAYKTVNGTRSTVGTYAYSATQDKYFRIRETNGTVFWDTSPDGLKWTTSCSLATPIPVTALIVEPTAGTWQAESSTSQVVMDDFNILPLRGASRKETLDSNVLKTLKIGDTYGPITSVVLGRQPQNDNVAIYSNTPFVSTIASVDATANSFTAAGHNMTSGNMIQLSSTGTLPAPLAANTYYYAHVLDANTFQLAPTYLDSVNNTNIIDLTSAGSGTITIPDITTKEIQINNNQIVDNDRQTMLPVLYDSLSGFQWSEVKADTIGLGWHEVGDVISFAQDDRTVQAFLSEVHLTLSGSIQENLISTIPDVAAINYQTAGGILKTIWNTEIKVDKQDNTITSVVARQDSLDSQIAENYTQITQDVADITLTVQKSGGGNLLLNSVGFAKEQMNDANNTSYGKVVSWDYPTNYSLTANGEVTTYDSSESQNFGGISGHVVQMSTDFLNNKTTSLKQRVNVAVNTPLSFGLRINKALGKGTAKITISNDIDSFVINVDGNTAYVWSELSLVNFVSKMSWLDIKVEATAEKFMFTDLRLLYGTTLMGWVQSNGEILSANVQFTSDGMRIFDESHDTETRVTYNEFSTRRRSDNTVLFEADDSGIVTNDLKINGSTSYVRDGTVVIKQITIAASNPRGGIAFIRVS